LPVRFLLHCVIAAFFVCAAILTANAQNIFEKLVMPGPLVEGHAKAEKDCANCHEAFTKSSQTRLCLVCHKETARDREQGRGMHGKRPDAARAECKTCHTDHKGRGADVVQFDHEIFNHAFTNFPLAGAHKSASCDGCHKPKTKFREAPGRCVDCHRSADKHKGRLGDGCQSCHNDETWSRVKTFDHAKTKFPLTGGHAEASCAACHPNEKYKGVPTVCASCHQLQDVHQGRYGAKCETCHVSSKWKTVRFDHAKTKYPLLGAHAKAPCEACHKGDLYRDKLQTSCVSCHKKDDAHAGKLGAACQQCHNEASWRKKVTFDHDLSRFPLLGQHAIVPCEECHKSTAYKDARTSCASCHRDEHHEGRLGQACGACHTPNGWKIWRFDHDGQTHFRLDGAHAGLACAACHRQRNVTKIDLPGTCYSCHANDDTHRGNFGRECQTCHTTRSFK
jgi:hypothetical protein